MSEYAFLMDSIHSGKGKRGKARGRGRGRGRGKAYGKGKDHGKGKSKSIKDSPFSPPRKPCNSSVILEDLSRNLRLLGQMRHRTAAKSSSTQITKEFCESMKDHNGLLGVIETGSLSHPKNRTDRIFSNLVRIFSDICPFSRDIVDDLDRNGRKKLTDFVSSDIFYKFLKAEILFKMIGPMPQYDALDEVVRFMNALLALLLIIPEVVTVRLYRRQIDAIKPEGIERHLVHGEHNPKYITGATTYDRIWKNLDAEFNEACERRGFGREEKEEEGEINHSILNLPIYPTDYEIAKALRGDDSPHELADIIQELRVEDENERQEERDRRLGAQALQQIPMLRGAVRPDLHGMRDPDEEPEEEDDDRLQLDHFLPDDILQQERMAPKRKKSNWCIRSRSSFSLQEKAIFNRLRPLPIRTSVGNPGFTSEKQLLHTLFTLCRKDFLIPLEEGLRASLHNELDERDLMVFNHAMAKEGGEGGGSIRFKLPIWPKMLEKRIFFNRRTHQSLTSNAVLENLARTDFLAHQQLVFLTPTANKMSQLFAGIVYCPFRHQFKTKYNKYGEDLKTREELLLYREIDIIILNPDKFDFTNEYDIFQTNSLWVATKPVLEALQSLERDHISFSDIILRHGLNSGGLQAPQFLSAPRNLQIIQRFPGHEHICVAREKPVDSSVEPGADFGASKMINISHFYELSVIPSNHRFPLTIPVDTVHVEQKAHITRDDADVIGRDELMALDDAKWEQSVAEFKGITEEQSAVKFSFVHEDNMEGKTGMKQHRGDGANNNQREQHRHQEEEEEEDSDHVDHQGIMLAASAPAIFYDPSQGLDPPHSIRFNGRKYTLQPDATQIRAIVTAVTQPFSVIEGGPGTGKSFCGRHIIRTLYKNRLTNGPILLVCLTNQALDGVLEGVIEDIPNLIRFGGRPRTINEKILARNIHEKEIRQEIKNRSKVSREVNASLTAKFGKSERDLISMKNDAEANVENMTKSCFQSVEAIKILESPLFASDEILNRNYKRVDVSKALKDFFFRIIKTFPTPFVYSISFALIQVPFYFTVKISAPDAPSLRYSSQSINLSEIISCASDLKKLISDLKKRSGDQTTRGRYQDFYLRFAESSLRTLLLPNAALQIWLTIRNVKAYVLELCTIICGLVEDLLKFRYVRKNKFGFFNIDTKIFRRLLSKPFSNVSNILKIFGIIGKQSFIDDAMEQKSSESRPHIRIYHKEGDEEEEEEEEEEDEFGKFDEGEKEPEAYDSIVLDRDQIDSIVARSDESIDEENSFEQYIADAEYKENDMEEEDRYYELEMRELREENRARLLQKDLERYHSEFEDFVGLCASHGASLWEINLFSRLRFFYTRLQHINERVRKELPNALKECRKYHDDLKLYRSIRDAYGLKQTPLLAMTSNVAARELNLLRELRPTTLICEESGEMNMAQNVALLLPSLQHVVMLGDHNQLRPEVEHELSSNYFKKGKRFGTDELYNFDVSLFEYISQHCTHFGKTCLLKVQRRMAPPIAQMLRATNLAPYLIDSEFSKGIGLIPTFMGSRIIFCEHNEKQDSSRSSRSHSNMYECSLICSLVLMLLFQGVPPNEIAILAMYKGQCMRMREELRKSAESVKEKFHGKYGKDCKGVMTKILSPSVLKQIRVVTNDSFQGEEADVVFVSLTRTDRCGFVSRENRILVALSRAKKFMMIVGHRDIFGSKSKNAIWRNVYNHVLTNGGVRNAAVPLRVGCMKHDTDVVVQKGSDLLDRFDRILSPCEHKCDKRMHCGHTCVLPCHNFPHNLVTCLKECGHECEICKNICRAQCYKCFPADRTFRKCVPCKHPVGYTGSCGHSWILECDEVRDLFTEHGDKITLDYDIDTLNRKAIVDQVYNLDKNNHHTFSSTTVPCLHCHITEFDDKFYAQNPKVIAHQLCRRSYELHPSLLGRMERFPQPRCPCMCGLIKPCGHACAKSCGHEKPCTSYNCMTKLSVDCGVCHHPIDYYCHQKTPGPCQRICGKECSRCGLPCQRKCHSGPCKCTHPCNHELTCGHKCSIPCYKHSEAEAKSIPLKCKCKDRCEFRCEHSSCSKSCIEPCIPCRERCVNGCEHRRCLKQCHEKCSVSFCDEYCDKQLRCGCDCRGMCGEPCPPCPIHEPEAYKKAISVIELDPIIDILREYPSRRVYYFKECEKVEVIGREHGKERDGMYDDDYDSAEDSEEYGSIERIEKYGHIMLVDEADQFMMHKYVQAQAEDAEIRPMTCPCGCGTPLCLSWRYERYWRPMWNLWQKVKRKMFQNPLSKDRPLSKEEKELIDKGMKEQQHSYSLEGHWFKHKCGLLYYIGDCGGATVTSKCPECGGVLGGSNHRVTDESTFDTSIDGAKHPSWSNATPFM
ncbi:DNA2/NAM7-like helicase like protein [Aduncisulcus paluster]|uniref:DNA2/NAM7-like helicase like protein n=1 Tax=Aduncisulcus paluster TaxID=2918883 RepID=A0ABQ5JXX1_9EUKA|nr:DNA2/NAM7-like helicase like protein [Aduncisulcus paluster]